MSLHIYLLGQFKILSNDIPLELSSRPAQSLLAFLSLNAGTVHRREKLSSMLWPETTDSNARSYLRQALWRINKAFNSLSLPAKHYLQVTDLTVSFNPISDYWLDAVKVLEPLNGQSLEQIIESIQHYKGELLPGFYDEWIPFERDRIQAAYHQKMTVLLDKLIQAREWNQVVKWSENWIGFGFAPEPAFRALMQAYANLGDKGMVSATYQRCEKALEQDLAVQPSMETQKLYQRICLDEPPVAKMDSRIDPKIHGEVSGILSGNPQIPFEQPTFVARTHELEQLNHFLERTLAGDGRMIFVIGEAGSGKSALISQFTQEIQLANPSVISASGNCNAQTGIGDPYLPFREILELLTGDVNSRWDAGAISQTHAQSLWSNLPIAARALIEFGPELIDTFLSGRSLLERVQTSISTRPDWYFRLEELIDLRRTGAYLSQSLQSTFFEQYTKVMQEISKEVPIILVLDDLQWADLGSTSMLFHLGRHLSGYRIMVIGAYRPEEVAIGREGKRHPLAPVVRELQRTHGEILINLDQAEGWDFMEKFLDSEPNQLGQEFRELLYRQTRGHPLFTIEFLRGLQDRGDLVKDPVGHWIEGIQLDWDTLPARVEAVITERIERLPDQLQSILNVACVEGDVFTAEVIAKVLGRRIDELLSDLSNRLDRKHRLVRAQSIQRVEGELISCYQFRHIQIQKYLYSMIDKVEKVFLHEKIGQTLENLYGVNAAPANLEDLSTSVTTIVQLAHQFHQAQIYEKAVSYLHLAGERALIMSAYQDAMTHLNKGLEILEMFPDSQDRIQQELSLLLAQGKALKGIEGMAPHSVEKIFTRAHYLAQQVDDLYQLCMIMGELAIVYYVRAEYPRARELAEETLRIAQEANDPILVAISHWQLGFVLFALGEFSAARDHLQKIISTLDPMEHHSQLIYLKGTNAVLSALAYDACCLWCLGYPDQAIEQSQKVFRLEKLLDHPFTSADVITFAGCLLNEMISDAEGILLHANQLIELSDKIGLGWRGAGWRHRGEALMMLGKISEGEMAIRKGMREEFSKAAQCYETKVLANCAYAVAASGQSVGALRSIEEVEAEAFKRNEFFSLAEIYRIKAEILWMCGETGEAEIYFIKAIEISKQQNAKSFELRAALGFAKLLFDQNKPLQALKVLEPVYQWFTEGFESPDLFQAKTFLSQIRRVDNQTDA